MSGLALRSRFQRLRPGGEWRHRAWFAPGVVLLSLLVLLPLARTFWRSLQRAGATTPDDTTFVGLGNYVEVAGSAAWWTAVVTALAVAVALTLTQLVLGLVFASSLRYLTVAWPVGRLFLLVPAAVLPVVAALAADRAVDGGFVSLWFRLDDPSQLDRLIAVALAELWRTTGIVTLIVYAGLARVPTSLLDSAVADGATPWQRWRRVVLPAAAPALAVAVGYRLLDSWRLLEGPVLVGDPDSGSTTAQVLIWDIGFSRFETGLAAAAAILLVALTALLALFIVVVVRARRAR